MTANVPTTSSFRRFGRFGAVVSRIRPRTRQRRGRFAVLAGFVRSFRAFARERANGVVVSHARRDLPASRPPASRYGNPMVTPSFPDALAAPLWGTYGEPRHTLAVKCAKRPHQTCRTGETTASLARSRPNARNDRTKPAERAKRPRRWHVRGQMRETTAPNLSNGRNDHVVGTFAVKHVDSGVTVGLP